MRPPRQYTLFRVLRPGGVPLRSAESPRPARTEEGEAKLVKIILIQPPIQDFYQTDIRLQPIGLCSLKSSIKKHHPNVQVKVLDLQKGWGRRTVSLPHEFSYLRSYYVTPDQSPFRSFHPYFHFGASLEILEREILKESPDLVGISSLFSPYHREAVACAQAIRAKLRVPVVLGGPHVSAMPELVLGHPAVDYIVRGEGERPMTELVGALISGTDPHDIANLGFKRNGQLFLNPTGECPAIEDLPPPDFSDFPLDQYAERGQPLYSILTSRGCPFGCSFCSVHSTFGKRYERRKPENVLDEMRTAYLRGYRVFDFEDDNLTLDAEAMNCLCAEIVRTFPSGDLRLLAMNGISYWTLDRDLLGPMREAGFTHLNLSLVSCDERLLRRLNRPHDRERFVEVVEEGIRLGLEIVAYQILGIPGDTLDAMVNTMAFLARMPVRIGASIFYLTPGSPIAAGFPPSTEIDAFRARSTAMAIETQEFGRDDLYTLFITARIINFIKEISMDTSSARFSDALECAEKTGGRHAIGGALLRRLLLEKTLFAWTRRGPEPLPRFRSDLFFQVLDEAREIATLKNRVIHC
jgi:radical SAM superfamily enzyme YgiQ (UPF0313 family)